MGGLIGYQNRGTTSYASIEGTITVNGSSTTHVGGIVGYLKNETTNVMSNRSQVSVSQIDSFMERLWKINEKGE